jgi:hypothetical protein
MFGLHDAIAPQKHPLLQVIATDLLTLDMPYGQKQALINENGTFPINPHISMI